MGRTASLGIPWECHCSSRPLSESSKAKSQGPFRDVHDCDGRTKSGRGYCSSWVEGDILGSRCSWVVLLRFTDLVRQRGVCQVSAAMQIKTVRTGVF